MAKRQRTKGQTMIHKTLHIKTGVNSGRLGSSSSNSAYISEQTLEFYVFYSERCFIQTFRYYTSSQEEKTS